MYLSPAHEQVEKVDGGLVRAISLTARGCLPPLVTTIGGFAAQEAIIALTGKFSPLQQWVREGRGGEGEGREGRGVGSLFSVFLFMNSVLPLPLIALSGCSGGVGRTREV